MPVMSALVLAIMLGLASAWTKASLISSFLEEFQKIILAIVSRVIIPILPYFIGLTSVHWHTKEQSPDSFLYSFR